MVVSVVVVVLLVVVVVVVGLLVVVVVVGAGFGLKRLGNGLAGTKIRWSSIISEGMFCERKLSTLKSSSGN